MHQAHPTKLALDVASALVALSLLWQRHIAAALFIGIVPPLLASLSLTGMDLAPLRDRPHGRYALEHLTRGMIALRAAGLLLAAVGALAQSWPLLLVGLAIAAASWARGLWARKA